MMNLIQYKNLEFQKTESSVFGNNLILVDSALPNIIAESLHWSSRQFFRQF